LGRNSFKKSNAGRGGGAFTSERGWENWSKETARVRPNGDHRGETLRTNKGYQKKGETSLIRIGELGRGGAQTYGMPRGGNKTACLARKIRRRKRKARQKFPTKKNGAAAKRVCPSNKGSITALG